MTLVVPGSAQLVGGNERLGRAALRVHALIDAMVRSGASGARVEVA